MEPPFFCESEQIRRETAWKTTCVWVWVLVEECQVKHPNFPRKNEPRKFRRVFAVLLYAKSTKNIKRWRNLFIKNLLRRNQIVPTDNEKNKNLYDKIYGQQLPRKGKGWHSRKEKARSAKKSMGQERIFFAQAGCARPCFVFSSVPVVGRASSQASVARQPKNTMGSDVP